MGSCRWRGTAELFIQSVILVLIFKLNYFRETDTNQGTKNCYMITVIKAGSALVRGGLKLFLHLQKHQPQLHVRVKSSFPLKMV